MNFFQSIIIYSTFYILYPPDYICLDSNFENPYSCSKDIACKLGQNYKFDSSNINKKLKALIFILIFLAKMKLKETMLYLLL